MTEENVPVEVVEQTEPPRAPAGPATPVTPPQSRFLFVDVAALRAKQIRRGATPRLGRQAEDSSEERQEIPFKPERIAMEEVRKGLVEYHVPDQKLASDGPVESS